VIAFAADDDDDDDDDDMMCAGRVIQLTMLMSCLSLELLSSLVLSMTSGQSGSVHCHTSTIQVLLRHFSFKMKRWM